MLNDQECHTGPGSQDAAGPRGRAPSAQHAGLLPGAGPRAERQSAAPAACGDERIKLPGGQGRREWRGWVEPRGLQAYMAYKPTMVDLDVTPVSLLQMEVPGTTHHGEVRWA